MVPIAGIVLATLAYGIPDHGIFPELADKVATLAPARAPLRHAWLRVDPEHGVVTLYDASDPIKAYPAALSQAWRKTRDPRLAAMGLREDDRAELARLLGGDSAGAMRVGAPPRAEDRDGDGIVDRLDILIGAKKLLHNHARYIERYVEMKYPGGDVPRTEGVCSDTVVRALRNAGIDLQKEVHEDILRAPKAYPMVEKVDASINHRRVKTLLPWFARHFLTLPRGEPYLPGDVVFFDTFPLRDGPEHLGVVSDTPGRTAAPLVINNWTDGAEDAEMDLLAFVPVTHHFRAPSPQEKQAQPR
jgi:uncharacterized protein YijF (DUF1287 family)